MNGVPMLFDDFERNDPNPKSGEEDSYTFLNRVKQPYWAEVRRVLEDWFSRYSADDMPKLAKDFRSPLRGQHTGAWWELYLHETFLRLGYEIEVHPELPDASTQPDFLLSKEGDSSYLEASVVFSGIVDDDPIAPEWLLDAIDLVQNPDFFVSVKEVAAAGDERLKRSQIVNPIQSWLDGLDADEVTAEFERTGRFEEKWISERGWKVQFEAWPVSREAHGKPDHRVLGAGPATAGFVNDISQLRAKLKSKAGRYGRPEKPLVTAILCASAFMDDEDVAQALLGTEAYQFHPDDPEGGRMVRQPNGFWFFGNQPTNQRVSAALVAAQLHPWNFLRQVPRLWLNPWADFPLRADLGFPTARASDQGLVSLEDGTLDMPEFFGLDPDWPPGEPFPRG
jgi:hypothetical protein